MSKSPSMRREAPRNISSSSAVAKGFKSTTIPAMTDSAARIRMTHQSGRLQPGEVDGVLELDRPAE